MAGSTSWACETSRREGHGPNRTISSARVGIALAAIALGGYCMMRRKKLTSVLLAIVLMAPLLAGACGKTVGETIDDATITTRVKTALLNDPAVGGLKIDVDTFKGVVTLSG